jgi:hypothetical protein
MRPYIVLLPLLLLAQAADAQRKGGKCGGEDVDSIAASGAPYPACAVDRPAKKRNDLRPFFRPDDTAVGTKCYRTELEFVVDTAGRPEPGDVRVVGGDSPELADAVRQALPGLRYSPAMRDGQPVRQWVRFKWVMATRVVVTRGGSGDPGRAPRC